MEKKSNQRYGPVTAASLVVGIVIGSGIFFKSDDILGLTGSILLGVLGFLLVGVGVVCGAVIISQYAINNPKEGGMVAYAADAFGPKFALIAAWLLQSVYFPAFIAILARITADYTVQLFGWDASLILPISLFYIVGCFIANYKSPEIGGKLQVSTTISKLIPLILIGLIGLFFHFDTQEVVKDYTETETNFFGALIAIAFAFDGWIVATSISGELKNAKKNLPLALILGTSSIVVIYIVYFAGISLVAGPEVIIANGNEHLGIAANMLLGDVGEKVILLFVVISAFGGTNGMTLAYLRLPKTLPENSLFNDRFNFKEVNEKTGISKNGAILCIFFLVFYLILDNASITVPALIDLKFDISALPIIPVYLVYTALYIGAISLLKKNNASIWYYVALVVGVCVALIILAGSLSNNGPLYLLISALMFIFLLPFLKKA